jgi:hypothetical protein
MSMLMETTMATSNSERPGPTPRALDRGLISGVVGAVLFVGLLFLGLALISPGGSSKPLSGPTARLSLEALNWR